MTTQNRIFSLQNALLTCYARLRPVAAWFLYFDDSQDFLNLAIFKSRLKTALFTTALDS